MTGRRTALVLGASAGLGLASALSLAARGFRVRIVSSSQERAAQASALLPGEGHAVHRVDLTSPTDVSVFCGELRAGTPVDAVVLNSGGPRPALAAQLGRSELLDSLESLLLSPVSVVEAVLPGMLDDGWGRIVAIGSSGVEQPIAGLATSNIGRSALSAYLKTLAAEVAADGITVNSVLPGRIDTDRVRQLDAGRAERTGTTAERIRTASLRDIPLGRYGEPEEFGAAVGFLCSDEASYVTGSRLRVDGGMIVGL
ncbi:SDR family oxidoreductase [Microbacterium sp. 18062]|uniref:SDR family oxidoreductase n=1 Tax=Microbacterium sp. 18062 TaxID=2681410 RepID=UPI0013581AF5|nr:SDR family oxidoreductase [Microbacterium sp. 18062]